MTIQVHTFISLARVVIQQRSGQSDVLILLACTRMLASALLHIYVAPRMLIVEYAPRKKEEKKKQMALSMLIGIFYTLL